VCPNRDLSSGLKLVGVAISNLAEQAHVDPSGSVLHVAVCNGSDALAVSDGAAKLLAAGGELLGIETEQFSSKELIGADGTRDSAKRIAQVVAAAVSDATTLLSVMKVGTISVLAAAALAPVRNGFVWDAAAKAFKCDPALRQVEPPVARLLELDKLPENVTYTPSRNRQWHMYNCSERKDGRTPELRRTFMRGLVRQMGSPAMLAATYSNNTEQVATAAVNELQEALVRLCVWFGEGGGRALRLAVLLRQLHARVRGHQPPPSLPLTRLRAATWCLPLCHARAHTPSTTAWRS
jgi:hypothetical protein